ncbi:Methyltransferase domain-containing protein [Marinobacter sp. DSM 26671]|uniref:BREX-1 system adenine-specific DNA-methyltransferase PglX n=1 Tax=Marinobacter sp. DSM 26671 TaxID=1761793 RepID=UPI0008EEA1AC|nr:BREX-1 system adenine-specific DNA-methyltransferase PglX [Marinobacter sp. DSM 26671]SFE76258.1 Methyltransferase domain-containing protein [Marinobacter sp. DSM 26671]
METAKLKKFAQFARRSLLEQVTAKLKLVLADESPARRERPQAIKKLEEAIADQGKEQVIERVAYIWFNRFCALRFMDVNRYNRIGIVSPAEGQFQPEILADAKMGHIDEDMVAEPTRQKIFALLDGKTPSQDPQGEAYRLLVVAACNYWHSAMPFLFERIDDYTELLMPDDLLSGNSILAYTREAMTPDACEDVEVIGWLYQFYISEKKDQVFADLKKNKKVTPENIPAATQLFTPHWIVRYLVENSLGRFWMLNRPDSGLIERMDYYIQPEEPETDFLRISSPEEIKVCDPACGSGHMLTYAFDLLYAIYEEEGYESAEIPAKILTHNLYGIEIDERAGELAAFALTMKARARQRRFFRKPVQPNIVVLENVSFTESEMQDVATLVGKDLFTDELRETLCRFEQAKNFGSLIVPKLTDPSQTLSVLEDGGLCDDILLKEVQARLVAVLRMAEVLSPKYHVVVANPPYMGRRGGMNDVLKKFINDFFIEGKADLYAAFLKRASLLGVERSLHGLVTMQSWMFLSSYKGIRELLVRNHTIDSVLHLGPRAFPEIDGEVVQVAATSFSKLRNLDNKPIFIRAVDRTAEEKSQALKDKRNFFSKVSQLEFLGIPDCPLPYWLPEKLIALFGRSKKVEDYSDQRQGLATGDDDRFLRTWPEVSSARTNWDAEKFPDQAFPWFPFIKGGSFRRWYGNNEHVIKFDQESFTALSQQGNCLPSRSYYLRESVVWSDIAGSAFAARFNPQGKVFATGALSAFPSQTPISSLLGYFNSNIHKEVMYALSSGMHYSVGYVDKSPYLHSDVPHSRVGEITKICVALSKSDWDSYETSWDFTSSPLLTLDHRAETLEASYTLLRTNWQRMTEEMQRLEEENSRIFIDAYGLHDELFPEVPLEEITLTCNPAYRYGVKGSEEDRETRLCADTMVELISYAVGCMFGRYALDKPGLILANQGETIADYLKQIPEPSFPADEDNVIPMLDGDWFTDDITERFREFLRIAFGEEHYAENLRFVEQALGKDIRKYFLKDFYNDHVRRYKKRPIYWLFSSPKGSFNALIYMHRYQPHTVGTVLEYLRDFKDEKLQARKNHLEAVSISAGASQGDKTKALKEIEKIKKILAELDDYERDVLYPLATEQVEIDLDDGVKVNYPKFGDALKKITGLSQ